jgi:hypothetical protein
MGETHQNSEGSNLTTSFGSLAKRMRVWRNRYVGLGDRVVLLISILNLIPIFYLFFMVMPVKVLEKDNSNTSKLLLCVCMCVEGEGVLRVLERLLGLARARCKPKSDGGLEVRDFRAVNLTILLDK